MEIEEIVSGVVGIDKEARRIVLDELRDRIMSLEPDVSEIATLHKRGFRSGHAACRYAARDLITEMLSEI